MQMEDIKAHSEDEKPEKKASFESLRGHQAHLKHVKHVFIKKGQKRDSHMKLYTNPVIRKNKDKWYVEFYYNVPQELESDHGAIRKRFKVYENINRLKGEEREEYAAVLRKAVHNELSDGYNPFEDIKKRVKKEAGHTMVNALKLYIEAKKAAGVKAIGSLQTPINHFEKWLITKGWEDKYLADFTEEDIIEFLETCRADEKWAAGTYNGNRTFVFMWFNWFALQKMILLSPLTKRIAIAKKTAVTRNEDYQGRVRELINTELDKDPALKRLCKGVYYTCARNRKELCYIKVWHVDRAGRVIKVPDGKTGYRHVPLCDELEDMLFNEMKIDSYPIDYYIFSEDAMPGKNPVHKNYFSIRYKKLKDDIGLGEEYSIYGWKHTRVCDLLASGLYTDHEVMELTGHLGTGSFDKYKRGLGRRITNKLKGKTISF